MLKWAFWEPVIQYGVAIPLLAWATSAVWKYAPAIYRKHKQRVTILLLTGLVEAWWIAAIVLTAISLSKKQPTAFHWFMILAMLVSRTTYAWAILTVAKAMAHVQAVKKWKERPNTPDLLDMIGLEANLPLNWRFALTVAYLLVTSVGGIWTLLYFFVVPRH